MLAFSLKAQVDVWPGDANNNGVVNHFDLLHFGLGYSYQGPPRGQKSVLFQAQTVGNWSKNLPDNLNFAHLDCNGNGHISLDDTIAIRLNYSQIHGSPQVETYSPTIPAGFPLIIDATFDSVMNYNQVNFDINLGDVANPLDSFYGLAFTLNYDAQRIQQGSFSVRIDSTAWINKSGPLLDQALLMAFEESSEGKLNIALSKSNLINAAGQGRILTIHCVIEDNLIGKGFQAMELIISDVLLIGNDLNAQAVQTNSKSIDIIPTGIDDKIDNAFTLKIHPNPAQDVLNIQTEENKLYSLNIFGLNGKNYAFQENNSGNSTSIDIHHLPSGIYFLQIKSGNQQSIQKFIKH
jgi:hypothetical protein